MTDVDLTGDHGASNKVDDKSKDINMAKDGLNVSNELPEVDLTVDTETVPNGSSNLGDNLNINPTQALVSPLGKGVTYLTGDDAEKAWQRAFPAPLTKPSSNSVLNGSSNKVIEKNKDCSMSGSKENPEDDPASTTKPANGDSPELADKSNYIDLCELEGGTEGALASTVSVSNKDGVVQAGDVTMGGEEEVVPSIKPVQSVGFSDGDDMILVGKPVNHLGDNTASNAG